MQLNDQPKSVIHLFSAITVESGYKLEEAKTRIRLLFDNRLIGGWADDRNGPHWYVRENESTKKLNPCYRPILEHFGFERMPDGDGYYWRVPDADGMWAFKRAVEEITGVRLTAT